MMTEGQSLKPICRKVNCIVLLASTGVKSKQLILQEGKSVINTLCDHYE